MKRWLKRVGIGLGMLVGLSAIALGVLVAISLARQSTTYEVRPAAIAIPIEPAALAEGERLWISRGCGDCHAADGAGRVVMDGPPARVVGTNLTVVTRGWPVEDHLRAIRHGVRPDGSPITLMPAYEYNPMSDEDVGRIIAHYTSLPRRETSLPATEVRLLGRVLHALDLFSLYSAERIDHAAPRRAPPAPAETVEYGAHLAIGCTGCHGEGLSGGPIPGAPPELGDPPTSPRTRAASPGGRARTS